MLVSLYFGFMVVSAHGVSRFCRKASGLPALEVPILGICFGMQLTARAFVRAEAGSKATKGRGSHEPCKVWCARPGQDPRENARSMC